jgi:GNAT superfamily N-acetyltransferase
MIIREANMDDIRGMHYVRNAVRENRLSDPNLVSFEDYRTYLSKRGKGWVCELDANLVGFAVGDLKGKNIWALFILPEYEGIGIGKKLQAAMLNWLFANTKETIWLSTARGSRAEEFYRRTGWTESGTMANGEVRFEMTYDEWMRRR